MSRSLTIKVANVSKLEKYYNLLPGGVDNEKVSATDIEQIINEIFHRRVTKFQRSSFVQRGIDDTWEIDLLDIPRLMNYNSRVRYLFIYFIFSEKI